MRRNSEDKSSPSTYSMVRNKRPSISPTSKTRHTFGVRNLPRQPHFLVKTLPRVLVVVHRHRQKFQRHGLIQLQIFRAKNFPHPAFTQKRNDPVAIGQSSSGHVIPLIRRPRSRRTARCKTLPAARPSPDVRALPNVPLARPDPDSPPLGGRCASPPPSPPPGTELPPDRPAPPAPSRGPTLVTVGLELSSTAVPHRGQNVARSGSSSAHEKHFMPPSYTISPPLAPRFHHANIP